MDLLLFFLAFIIGFGIFISSAYFIAKLMFPRLEDEEAVTAASTKKNLLPRINKHSSPYFFSKNHPYSFK
ncbi:hypothetical protein BH09BAC3_BH09BAC3_19450 [soil metagenome]